jgi:hypothetical protein
MPPLGPWRDGRRDGSTLRPDETGWFATMIRERPGKWSRRMRL